MCNWHYRPAWTQLGLRQNLVGLEVGVDKGTNARFILQNLSIEKLYLIDPYFEQSENFNSDNERPYIEGSDLRDAYKIAKKALKSFDSKIIWLIGTTEEKIVEIADNSLDFVYIDGCHEYEYVKKDIELCFPKVKKGGVLGGHDFCKDHPSVVRAVLDKFDRNDIFVMNRDFWIVK